MTERQAELKEQQDPVPITDFGRDHWSTFAYVECVCVDGGGVPSLRRMRCNPKTHPQFAHLRTWDEAYGTRLKGHLEHFPRILPQHDDWDCINDLVAAGLMSFSVNFLSTSPVPQFKLTEKGQEVAALLRIHKARGEIFSTFNPDYRPGKFGKFMYGKGKRRNTK